MPASSDRQAALQRVYQDARAAGLDDEGARVAVAIAITEAGYGGAVGDLDHNPLGAAGTFQFNFGGGQGNNFARANGMTDQQARDYLRQDPHAGNAWALRGYLGQAIRDGQQQGLHGAQLATYAQREGQRSVSPERSGANYQTISDTGGASVDPQQAAASRAQDIFEDVVRRYGDPVSILPAPGEAEVDTETPELNFLGDPTGKTVKSKGPNPNPWYRYTFQDPKTRAAVYLDLRTPGGKAENIEIRGGTALGTAAGQGGAAGGSVIGGNTANEQFIVVVHPDGTVSQQPNPNYVAPKKPNNKTVVTRNGKSFIYDPDTNEFTPATGLPDETPKHTTHAVGGRLYTLDENGNVVATRDVRTSEEIRKGQLEVQKAEQDLLPQQQRILQGHLDTVKYVQGMLERGEIDQSQADAYVQLSKSAAEAGLRGTTPFNEMKERREAEQARQRMGTDLLQQRLQSGSSLGSSLLSAASSLGSHAMLRPGQTSIGVDPLAQLMPLLNELQGGADVTPYARGLLMGAQAGPAPGLPRPASMPAGL